MLDEALLDPVSTDRLAGAFVRQPHDGAVCLALYRHPERPGRVFKLVDGRRDGFAAYAGICLGGLSLVSPHFLRVHSITALDDGQQLIEVEELVPASYLREDEIAAVARRAWRYLTGFRGSPPTPLDAAAARLFETFGLDGMTPDLRPENLMARVAADGSEPELVINDPYGRRHRRTA